MTLSFSRAIKYGGLHERALSASASSDDEVSHAFLASSDRVVTISGHDGREGIADLATRVGDNEWIIPLMVQQVGAEGEYYGAFASLENRDLNLKIRSGRKVSFIKCSDSLHRASELVLNDVKERLGDPPASPPGQAEDIRAINTSMLEGFIWSEMVRKIKKDHEVNRVILSVSPEVLVNDTKLKSDEELPSVIIEYGENEVPGAPFKEYLWVEYLDAKNSLKERGLTLKNVCGIATRSTCLGGEASCDYRDYVFARATGRCSACATQEFTRDKFKVK